MKLIKIMAAIFLLTSPAITIADDASREQARILLEVIELESVLEQSIQQMLDLQIQQNPGIAPFRDVMLRFLGKHMSYESLQPEMISLYAEAFTAAELKEITAFHRTPTGQKSLRELPRLMREGANIGAARVQENIEELQTMIAEEAAKLKDD